MKKKNLLFDADGTIWDSARPVVDSWNIILEEKYSDIVPYRLTLDDMYHSMGKTMTDIADSLFPHLEKNKRLQVLTDCMAYENDYLASHPGRFYLGLTDTLKSLKEQGCHNFIVSNCQDGYLEAMLASNKELASVIEDTECFGRTGLPKSGSICLLLERHGIAKEEAVYIGDTSMDEKAAREAGISFIHAAYGFGKAERPDGIIKDIRRLPDLLNS